MASHHPKPWRRGSLFTLGPRCPLNREQRARFRYLLNEHVRHGRLPAKCARVGEALLKRLGVDGQCDPSHETLAADACCSARTVRRATSVMRFLGLLHWQTRLIRTGWRAEQTSNAYELIPSLVVSAPLRPPCGGQSVRPTRRIDIPFVPQVSPDERQAAQAALAKRRAVIEQRLLEKRCGFEPGGSTAKLLC